MTSVVHDCPYCGSASAAFALISDAHSQVKPSEWYSLARCGVCKEVALVKTVDIDHLSRRVSTSRAPMDFGKEKAIQERYTLVDFHPVVTPPDIPEAIPENVRVSFSEAEAAYSQRLLSSAAACYRKSIERAVKVLHPEGKGTLNARIRQIEVQGLLPQTLVDLLDNVRILGNLSVHEDEVDPTKEECDAARHFARLFLVYTFSLPARIAALKKEVDSDTT